MSRRWSWHVGHGCHWSHASARPVRRRHWRAAAAQHAWPAWHPAGRTPVRFIGCVPSLAAAQLCMAPAASMLAAASSAGLGLTIGMLPTASSARRSRARHDATSSRRCCRECRGALLVPPALLLLCSCFSMRDATDGLRSSEDQWQPRWTCQDAWFGLWVRGLYRTRSDLFHFTEGSVYNYLSHYIRSVNCAPYRAAFVCCVHTPSLSRVSLRGAHARATRAFPCYAIRNCGYVRLVTRHGPRGRTTENRALSVSVFAHQRLARVDLRLGVGAFGEGAQVGALRPCAAAHRSSPCCRSS